MHSGSHMPLLRRIDAEEAHRLAISGLKLVQVPNIFGMPQSLQVPPDPETLAKVAEMTGGRFFEAPTAEDLASIYESLGSKVGYVQEETEVTQLFAAAGLLLVLVGGALAAHWFNRFP